MSATDPPPPAVGVVAATAADAGAAAALAARIGAPAPSVAAATRVRHSRPDSGGWTLLVEGTRRVLARPDGARLEIDFGAGRVAARAREGGRVHQPLARAVGVARLRRQLAREPRVVDATGGLGRDAWFVASLGCPVTMIERSPLVHSLLEAALARAALTPAIADVAGRIRLLDGDAVERLAALEAGDADVVYLDPMYPPTRRRAAVSKGMQFLHALLADPVDDGALLAAALGAAARHVAVKRPAGAPPLTHATAHHAQRSTIASPNTRYDIYHVR